MDGRTTGRIFGFLLFVILGLATYAVVSSKSEKVERAEAKHYANCRIRNQTGDEKFLPKTGEVAAPVQLECESDANEGGGEFWPPVFGLRLKITDSLLVAFTGLLWWSTWGLVSDAKKSSERQLRAYVHVKRCDITKVDYAGFPTAAVTIQNYGTTPAHKLNWTIRIEYAKVADESSLVLSKPTKQNTSLAPSGIMYRMRTWDDNIGEEVLSEIGSGMGAIYVYGTIRYRDVFEHDRETNLRLRYRGKRDGDGKPILEACEQGNDAT